MFANFMQRTKVNLDEHRNDHDPDQKSNRQINLSDLHASNGLEHTWKELSECNSRNDAKKYPNGEVTLEYAHWRYIFCIVHN